MEMESFSVFFVKLKKSCEDGNTCEIQTFFPEAMKIMTWIHERTMKFLNIEAVNVFKVDPAIFENLSKDVQASNCQNIEKEVENCDKKKIFDKEYYLKTCHDDEMQSKFKMYALIDDLFKDGTGLLYEIKKSFERNQINETLSQLKFILEKIKYQT